MELVTHTCGQQIWRQETGGVARIVRYARLGDQREIDDCPGCGENLADADLRDADGRPIREAPSAAFSDRLKQTIEIGMVVIDDQQRRATIMAPTREEDMSDVDWLIVLKAAGEVKGELERLGYTVSG